MDDENDKRLASDVFDEHMAQVKAEANEQRRSFLRTLRARPDEDVLPVNDQSQTPSKAGFLSEDAGLLKHSIIDDFH